MIWKFNDTQTASVSFPLVLSGVNEDFSVTLENDSAVPLTNVVLFTSFVDHLGVITAKKSTDSTYRTVGNFFDTACLIGDIEAESEVEIDFRINFPSDTPDALITLPIFVGYGDGFTVSGDQWDDDDEFWLDSEGDFWE